MRKIGFIILTLCFLSNYSNAQLIGCPAGCDTLLFSSQYNTTSENWKVIPLAGRCGVGCAVGVGDRWEWGTAGSTANTVCVSPYTARPPHPSGQTKFWATELDGCFCNSCTGGPLDSMYKFKFFDFTGSNIKAPVQLEIEHVTDGCGPDNMSIHVAGTRINSYSHNTLPIWLTEIEQHPLLDALVGTTSSLGIGFFMTSVCNGNGATIASFKIRTCRISCSNPTGGPIVPTMGEWGLICLFLFFINLGLIYKIASRRSIA